MQPSRQAIEVGPNHRHGVGVLLISVRLSMRRVRDASVVSCRRRVHDRARSFDRGSYGRAQGFAAGGTAGLPEMELFSTPGVEILCLHDRPCEALNSFIGVRRTIAVRVLHRKGVGDGRASFLRNVETIAVAGTNALAGHHCTRRGCLRWTGCWLAPQQQGKLGGDGTQVLHNYLGATFRLCQGGKGDTPVVKQGVHPGDLRRPGRIRDINHSKSALVGGQIDN